jgi:hypothetical protein
MLLGLTGVVLWGQGLFGQAVVVGVAFMYVLRKYRFQLTHSITVYTGI